MRLLEKLVDGDTSSPTEYASGLVALNAMVDSWRNDSLNCFATRTEAVTMVAATSSYTIGPSGSLNTTRPVKIEAAWIDSGGLSYQVEILSDTDYDAIPFKASTGDFPSGVNYRATMPTGTLKVWPVPIRASTLNLRTWTPFTAFAAITDTVSLPPGWEEALAFNLAIEISSEFSAPVAPSVSKRATESLASIKRVNSRRIVAKSQIGQLIGGARPNILYG